MKNNQRKNKKSLVVVAIILMIGLVSGMGAMTYSRYISSGSTGTQQATAAKWGFVVTANTDGLFGTNYNNATAGQDGDAQIATITTSTGDISVKAASTAKIVAPGTTGKMSISVNGVAEVKAKVTFKFDETLTSDIALVDDGADVYNPVRWSISGGGLNATNLTLAQLITTLENASATIEAGTSLDNTYTITWEWAFNTGANEDEKLANSIKDTLIGFASHNATAADADKVDLSTTYGPDGVTTYETHMDDYDSVTTTLKFALTIVVEQIQ